jgi:hypothetical protein
VLGLLVLVPAAAFAQASITGVVKDSSGAVLPGVTVEASSPALIEKTRTAVTDGSGQYRILDLRAGNYSIVFTLTGFNAIKRKGIELSGAFTAVVNADLNVGAVAETITVTGETPIVDTQSTRRQTVISNDLITSIPSARSYAGLMTLMPNTVVAGGAASDVQVVPGMVVFGGAGGRGNEGRLHVDGLSVGSAFNGAGVSAYIPDVGNAQEVTMITSGGLGEARSGRSVVEYRAEDGRQLGQGQFLCLGRDQRDDRRQLHAGAQGPGSHHTGHPHEGLGLQRRRRRADLQGSPVVLSAGPTIVPTLHRSLSNAAPTATVNLIEPGTLYGDRVNELDFHVAKILKFGRLRTNVGIDIYNLTNRAPALTYNQSFVLPPATSPNGSWLTPLSPRLARFLKISAQFDF